MANEETMSKYCDICPNSDSDGISVYCNVKRKMVNPDSRCPDYGKFFKKRERNYPHYYGGGNFGRKKDKDYKIYWERLDKCRDSYDKWEWRGVQNG